MDYDSFLCISKKKVITDTRQLAIRCGKLSQLINSSTHLSGRNEFYTLPFMAFILLRLICICTYIIVIYSFLYDYTNKGEERENRVTLYSFCYHYCLLIQDQSVIVRRSVHSFSFYYTIISIKLLPLPQSHGISNYIQSAACMSDLRVSKYVYFMRKNIK
jgi:uncharacterized protein YggT (Ycf19 family)